MANKNLQSLVLCVAGSIRGNVAGMERKVCADDQTTAILLSLPQHSLPSEPAYTSSRRGRGAKRAMVSAAQRAGRLAGRRSVWGNRSLTSRVRGTWRSPWSRPTGSRFPGYIRTSGLFGGRNHQRFLETLNDRSNEANQKPVAGSPAAHKRG